MGEPMNEGVIVGRIRSTQTGADLAGATVALANIRITQELGGTLPLYNTADNLAVPTTATSNNGRFALWFHWDGTNIGAVVSGINGSGISYVTRVLVGAPSGGNVVTQREFRFLLHNMRLVVAPLRILGLAGVPSFGNLGPPVSDQLWNFAQGILSMRVPTHLDPGNRTAENYMLVAFADLYYPYA